MVGRVVRRRDPSVSRGMGLREVRALRRSVPYGKSYATTDDGRPYGTITLAETSETAFD